MGEFRTNGGAGELHSDRLDDLLPHVYQELRTLAVQALRRERDAHTLTPTALVHEAYVRLAAQLPTRFSSTREFCAAFAVTMRRVLVDYARQHTAAKRTPSGIRVSLSGSNPQVLPLTVMLLDLDSALAKLGEVCRTRARIVELRFFGGLTEIETAEELGLSRSAVQKHWRSACAWLRTQLRAA